MFDYIEKVGVTLDERHAVLFLLGFVLAITELVKRLYRWRTGKHADKSVPYTTSVLAGAIGAFFLWPRASATPWFIAAPIAGVASMYTHKWVLALIRWKAPKLAEILAGHRRRRNLPPPGGIERRSDG